MDHNDMQNRQLKLQIMLAKYAIEILVISRNVSIVAVSAAIKITVGPPTAVNSLEIYNRNAYRKSLIFVITLYGFLYNY